MSRHHRHHCEEDECTTKGKSNIDKLLDCGCHIKEEAEECKPHFTKEQALQVAQCLGIDTSCGFDLEQFRLGMDIELEHGLVNPLTNISNNDPIITGKIALAHLNEFPDYYKRLVKMEEEAKKYWKKRRKYVKFIS